MSQSLDVEWDPPIETGLSGNNPYPNVQIEPFIESLDEAHQRGVYVLRLSYPTGGRETHNRLWLQDHDDVPNYLDAIIESNGILYVGSSSDVLNRLNQHLNDDLNRSTTISDTYPIHSVVNVDFYPDEDVDITHKEQQKTDALNDERSGMYIHSR